MGSEKLNKGTKSQIPCMRLQMRVLQYVKCNYMTYSILHKRLP